MEPVTSRLEEHRWSSEESVSFEVAVEAISEVVGAYTALAEREPERAEEYRRERRRCHADRRALRADDTAAVARVRASYAAELAELRTRLG
ncbi:hypothetical protein IHE61_31275 [Streptomyces sp. GKU 257-1]|nr:hypothetical protein [Streptomyces sp. GKU 257-1]